MSDLRFVVRTLRQSPAFVLSAVLTLTLGIAANVTVFALVDAVLLRPLSTFQPERVVRLGTTTRGGEQNTRFAFAYADYRDIAERATAITEVSASALTPFVLRAGDNSSEILGEI